MKKYLLFYSFVLSLFFISATMAQIEIDGVMFDWDENMRLDVEPNNTGGRSLFFGEGDPYSPSILYGNPDANYKVNIDLGPVYAHDDAQFLYLRATLNPLANVSTIATDTSLHGGASFFVFMTMDPDSNVVDTITGTRGDSTGLRYGGTWASAYDMFAQVFPNDSAAEANTDGQAYMWQHSQVPGAEWGWGTMQESVADTTVGIKLAWNGDNNDIEFAIPKSIFANAKYFATKPGLIEGDSVGIWFHFQENTAPWWGNFICNSTAGWSKGSAYGLIYKWKKTYVSTGVNDNELLPTKYGLSQNYPNPFNPSTKIQYNLPKSEHVTLRVTNIIGQEVAVLVNDIQDAGLHTVNFNASNLTSGVYFYTIEAGNFSQTNKMTILK